MDPAVDFEEEGQREDEPSPPWVLRVALKFLLMFVKGGIEYCGTLCVTIGLAARWVYWLMVSIVVVALVQLAYWTYVWVIRPLGRFAVVLVQYLVGRAPWDEVLTHHGRTPFRLVWYGPTGQVAWTAQYVQDKVRGRGTGQAPFDLLVTDGTALARLRHSTVRGRTNRHGFICPCDTVHGSSHRYWRHTIEGAHCRVHLCSQSPCTAPEAAEVHVTSSAVVPREVEIDLTELAGKGPFGRCLTATWLLSAQGFYFWKWLGGGACSLRRKCCRLCGCGARPRRGPRPGGEHGSEPSRLLHEWSETEREGEDNAQACQADQLAWEEGGKTQALGREPCKDLALGNSIPVLPADMRLSDKDGLQEEDGVWHVRLCPRHAALYGHSSARRKCAVEGCVELSRTTKGGVRLCKLHGAKEERKPSSGPGTKHSATPDKTTPRRGSAPGDSVAQPDAPTTPRSSPTKPRITSTPPGLGRAQGETESHLLGLTWDEVASLPDPTARLRAIRAKTSQGREAEGKVEPAGDGAARAEALGKLVRNVALGQSAAKAYQVACQEYGLDPLSRPLQPAAREYLPRLPLQYPRLARKVLEEIAGHGQPQERDPVLGAFHAFLQGAGAGGEFDLSAGAPVSVSSEQHHPAFALYGGADIPAARLEPGATNSQAGQGRGAVPQERPPVATASLFRPRGEGHSDQGNSTRTAAPYQPGGALPEGYQVLADAVRPFHAGAYTDAEPPRLDESAKALQAIARSLVKDDQGQEKGKLSAIGRQEERLVFLLRGCDSLDIPLAAGVVGKELFHSLRAAATQARPKLRQLRFPVNLTNRLCYALASASFGAKDVKALPHYCGSAADFPQTEEADFDAYTSPPDLKLEARPRGPTTISTWLRNALRQAWGLACVYGQQHYAVWEAAALHLTKLGEEHSYAWPAHVIFDVWEELWSRFFEELREVDRELRRLMREESPTFDRMKFVATAPNYEGQPWLRLPGTFRLDDPREYFTTDVLDRLQRQLSRAAWAQALRGPRAPPPSGGGRAGDASGDSQLSKIEDQPTRAGGANKGGGPPPALIGPGLTPKETARALEHRPRDADGHYQCWDFFSNRGCRKTDCSLSHKGSVKWKTLDYAIKLQLLRRGGLRGSRKQSSDELVKEMTSLRSLEAQDQAAKVQEGGGRRRPGRKATRAGEAPGAPATEPPSDPAPGTRAGELAVEAYVSAARSEPGKDNAVHAAPAELCEAGYTLQEEGLWKLVQGADYGWYEDQDQGRPGLTRAMKAVEALLASQDPPLANMPDLLTVFVRNYLLHDNTPASPQERLQACFRVAATLGGPELASQAADYLESTQRLSHAGSVSAAASVGRISWDGDIGFGTFEYDGTHWRQFDYQDRLPLALTCRLSLVEASPKNPSSACCYTLRLGS